MLVLQKKKKQHKYKMIATFVVVLLMIGSVWSRSLPIHQISDGIMSQMNGETVLIRNPRQSGGSGK